MGQAPCLGSVLGVREALSTMTPRLPISGLVWTDVCSVLVMFVINRQIYMHPV